MNTRRLCRKIESEIGTMRETRDLYGWSRKMLAASYTRHRTTGRTAFPEIKLYNDDAVRNMDHVINGLMGALFPDDGSSWFSYTLWGDNFELSRLSRLESSSKISFAKRDEFDRNRKRRVESGQFVTIEDVPGAKDFIQDTTRKVLTLYTRNGYYDAKRQQLEDAYVLGFGAMMVVHDAGKGPVNGTFFETFNPIECFIATRPGTSQVVVFAREFTMTSGEIWMKWKDSPFGVPSCIREDRENGLSSVYTLYEMFCPNDYLRDEETGDKLGPQSGEIQHYVFMKSSQESAQYGILPPVVNGRESSAIEEPDNIILEMNTFKEMPVNVLYFRKNGNNPYGTGIVESCIEEIIELNQSSFNRQTTMDFFAKPMWAVPINSNNSFIVRPGQRVSVRTNEDVPVQLSGTGNYSAMSDDLALQKSELKEAMWVNIFQTLLSLTDTRKTATEVNFLKTEAAQVAVGMIGNARQVCDSEARRVIRILEDAGIVASQDERINQILHMCILRFNTQFFRQLSNFYMQNGIEMFISYIAQIYKIYPEIVDIVDFDGTTRDISTACGFNEYNIREASEVEERRKQRSELATQQYLAQMQNTQSQTAYNNSRAGLQGADLGGVAQ